jgi:hypothetical protein
MTATATAAATTRPAHRDPQVLRWLGAYTASALGDSVYHLALSWTAVSSGTPPRPGSSWRSRPCLAPCSCSSGE